MTHVKLLGLLAVVVLAVIAAYILAGIIIAIVLFALVIGVISGVCEQLTDRIKQFLVK